MMDGELNDLAAKLPEGPRVAILGSTSFFDPLSEAISIALGQALAEKSEVVLLTGGVSGVGQAFGTAFFEARERLGLEPKVFHLLPAGMDACGYGVTYSAGSSMAERRVLLASLASIYVVIEGGPGTVDESEVAVGRGASLVPIAVTGGHALDLYASLPRPEVVTEADWIALGQEHLGPEAIAAAALRVITALLERDPSSD